MTVGVKICGVTSAEACAAATSGGASHLGFVFYPPSPRDIALDRAAALGRTLRDRVRTVGVFVDADDALLAAAVGTVGLDIVQLHGSEPPARVAAIRQALGREVWKAVPVRTRADLAGAAAYRGAADRIVFDAKPAPGGLPGGGGLRFDWRLLAGYRHALPWVLSGGLDAASVAEAVATTGASIVDVSSGVEREPGVKDVDKIAAFLQAAHAA